MDEQAEYAVLSKAAYDFFHGGEALAQLELQEYGLGDHSIDEALSDNHAVVITRPDGSAVVSYRGTDHMSDLAPDFQIALGYHHNPRVAIYRSRRVSMGRRSLCGRQIAIQ